MSSRSPILSEQLSTLHTDNPRFIRRRIVEILRARIPSDFCLYFQCITRDGEGPFFTGEVSDGDQELRDALLPYAGQPAVPTPWLGSNLDPHHIDTFIRTRSHYSVAHLRTYEITQRVFEPLQVSDQLRVLLYDGVQFVGWLGLMRRGDDRGFSAEEKKLAQSVVPELKSGLIAARNLEKGVINDGIFAVLLPDGSIKHASSGFRKWMTFNYRDYLQRRIRDIDTGRRDRRAIELHTGAEVRVVRLDGPDGVRYLVTVASYEPVRFRPEYHLTERQRDIVKYAVTGQSSREIADSLELSFHTVNTHMKNIYRRLDISTRAELAAMFTHLGE